VTRIVAFLGVLILVGSACTHVVSLPAPRITPVPSTTGIASTTTAPTGISPVGNQPMIASCGPPEFEPTLITLACGDGGVSITNIIWSVWNSAVLGSTAPVAEGNATFNWNHCIPNCAEGQTSSVPVTITASNLVSYAGSQVWGTLEVDTTRSYGPTLPGDLESPPATGLVDSLLFTLPRG